MRDLFPILIGVLTFWYWKNLLFFGLISSFPVFALKLSICFNFNIFQCSTCSGCASSCSQSWRASRGCCSRLTQSARSWWSCCWSGSSPRLCQYLPLSRTSQPSTWRFSLEASVCVKTTIFLVSVYPSSGEFPVVGVCDSFYLVMYDLNHAVAFYLKLLVP